MYLFEPRAKRLSPKQFGLDVKNERCYLILRTYSVLPVVLLAFCGEYIWGTPFRDRNSPSKFRLALHRP